MTEEEYMNELESATGLKAGTDFGFTFGSRMPYWANKGMQSSSTVDGYSIWKKNKDGSTNQIVTKGLTIHDTIKFLILPEKELIQYFEKEGITVIKHE